ncbi:MAG TPA: circadian clock protein KaiC [Kofleriaceae bacterium]|nr:circadian clock protein KaiC [Kofleriaceae bacterium]
MATDRSFRLCWRAPRTRTKPGGSWAVSRTAMVESDRATAVRLASALASSSPAPVQRQSSLPPSPVQPRSDGASAAHRVCGPCEFARTVSVRHTRPWQSRPFRVSWRSARRLHEAPAAMSDRRPRVDRSRRTSVATLPKVPTGITGFDEITGGGLPRGRPSLVCGGPGCGKTLFAMEFIVRGAAAFGEPGAFIAFEETRDDLIANVASLGFDLVGLERKGLLSIDFVRIDRSEIHEAGDYDLEGLFVRLAHAIDAVKARRIVLDTLEALFAGFDDEALLRSELQRLFRWLKERGLTAVITGERGAGQLTRYGLEEYVSDCVILLDNRIEDQVSTRRLQVVKYRGSPHGGNEYPFLIDEDGISVLPITSLTLDYPVSDERVSTGVPALDGMLDGRGYFRGSSVLVSGTAGTGKSTLAALFVDAACRRKERALYFALEESAPQVRRNMQSIGLDLEGWEKKKLLQVRSARPTAFGLEMHLVAMHKLIEEVEPSAVVIDPISSLISAGSPREVRSMLVRLFDYLKLRRITCLVTALTHGGSEDDSVVGISSLIDSWFQVRDIELDGERTRGLYLVKSRGMGHSNQVREFVITSGGVDLVPVAVGPRGVLTGSARLNLEVEQRAARLAREHEAARQQRTLASRRRAIEAQIEALRAELSATESDVETAIAERRDAEERRAADRAANAAARSATRGGAA